MTTEIHHEGDSQCPTCGSVVMASDIEERSDRFEFCILGLICGVVGSLFCVAILLATGALQPGVIP